MTNVRMALLARKSATLVGAMIGLTVAGDRAASAQVLYNGSLGTKPGQQGWLTLGNVNLVSPTVTATETYVPTEYTDVNSAIDDNIYAGYSNYNLLGQKVNSAFPTLNSTTGFTLNFTIEVEEDNNVVPPGTSGEGTSFTGSSTPVRAGFSVILLDSNHQGIELGFTPEGIFSQSSDFSTTSEQVSTLLPSDLDSYTLTEMGGTYSLYSAGSLLLTGSTKQYTGTGALASLVYNEPNLVFLGDDTTADGGIYDVAAVSIQTAASAPEPAAITFAIGGLGLLSACGRAARRRGK